MTSLIKSILVLHLFLCAIPSFGSVVRAAIDVGSGGPKLRVEEVDLSTHRIARILQIQEYPVAFQDALSRSNDRMLSPQVIHQGLEGIKAAITTAKSFEAEKIVILGASIFRNAANGEQFANEIQKETSLPVYVLDQDLEGKLAFQAALAHTGADGDNLVVWDLGGGSYQFIGADEIYKSHDASGPFRDYIIETIQGKNLKEHRTPNPITREDAVLAEAHAFVLSFKVHPVFQIKTRSPSTQVVGVGSAFSRGIAPLMEKNHFTVGELALLTQSLIGKADSDLGNSIFSCCDVSNALLVLGFMKGLGIKEMTTVDINNADGALLYKNFWE